MPEKHERIRGTVFVFLGGARYMRLLQDAYCLRRMRNPSEETKPTHSRRDSPCAALLKENRLWLGLLKPLHVVQIVPHKRVECKKRTTPCTCLAGLSVWFDAMIHSSV